MHRSFYLIFSLTLLSTGQILAPKDALEFLSNFFLSVLSTGQILVPN